MVMNTVHFLYFLFLFSFFLFGQSINFCIHFPSYNDTEISEMIFSHLTKDRLLAEVMRGAYLIRHFDIFMFEHSKVFRSPSTQTTNHNKTEYLIYLNKFLRSFMAHTRSS